MQGFKVVVVIAFFFFPFMLLPKVTKIVPKSFQMLSQLLSQVNKIVAINYKTLIVNFVEIVD